MAQYLLLRNNKESGPYTLDDLIGLGLKPYDLVWVQGKSAAWRYPSEVEELKAYSPSVEEQPFDRFFKKNEEKKEETPRPREATVATPQYEKYLPKKSVYVNMPGQKDGAVNTIQGQKNSPAKQVVKETVADNPVQPTISVSENPISAQVKYSQPLDEIKEMYVKTLYDRKHRIARKNLWLQALKKASVLLLLIAIGLVAGFMIKSTTSNTKVQAATEKLPQQEPAKSAAAPPKDTVARQENTEIKVLPPPPGGFVNKEVLERKPVQTDRTVEKMSTGSMKKDPLTASVIPNETRNSFVAQGANMDPATGERDKRVRNRNDATTSTTLNSPNNATNTTARQAGLNDLSTQVTVTCNDYKRVAFGGIRDLQLSVTNDSRWALDNVTVELQYLKPSEQPLKTQNVQFTSIGPKSTSTIRVPDTNRGIKVIFHIVSIKRHDEDVAGN